MQCILLLRNPPRSTPTSLHSNLFSLLPSLPPPSSSCLSLKLSQVVLANYSSAWGLPRCVVPHKRKTNGISQQLSKGNSTSTKDRTHARPPALHLAEILLGLISCEPSVTVTSYEHLSVVSRKHCFLEAIHHHWSL